MVSSVFSQHWKPDRNFNSGHQLCEAYEQFSNTLSFFLYTLSPISLVHFCIIIKEASIIFA